MHRGGRAAYGRRQNGLRVGLRHQRAHHRHDLLVLPPQLDHLLYHALVVPAQRLNLRLPKLSALRARERSDSAGGRADLALEGDDGLVLLFAGLARRRLSRLAVR